MNFLFGAVLLILLILPGILFRLAYISVPSYSKAFRSSFQEEIIFAVGPAFLLQCVGFIITQQFCSIDENQLYLLLINNDKATANNPITNNEIGLFLLYNIALGIIAVLLGWLTRVIAIKTNFHQRFHFLRLFNDWELFFEGYILDNPDVPGSRAQVAEKWVDVLVSGKDGELIYTGLLVDYVVNREEKLERIYLLYTRRRRFTDDDSYGDIFGEQDATHTTEEEIDQRYYQMPGDFFVILGSEIKNINITYFSYEIDEAPPEENSTSS